MNLSTTKTLLICTGAIFLVIGTFNAHELHCQEDIAMQDVLRVWSAADEWGTPWAIQFNEDGTFRLAHTHLRLEKSPRDEGRFKLEGTSLTLISNKDCVGSCKGSQGIYILEISEDDTLILKEEKDNCIERKEVCVNNWSKIAP